MFFARVGGKSAPLGRIWSILASPPWSIVRHTASQLYSSFAGRLSELLKNQPARELQTTVVRPRPGPLTKKKRVKLQTPDTFANPDLRVRTVATLGAGRAETPTVETRLKFGPRTPPRVQTHQLFAQGAAVATRKGPRGPALVVSTGGLFRDTHS